MCGLEALKIDFLRMEGDAEERSAHLKDAFFEAVEATEVRHGDVVVTLTVKRTGSFFDVNYHFSGTLVLPCDLCLDDMEQPVEGDGHVAVRLGEEYSEDDDVVTIDEREGTLDMAWLVYESIALSIPIKHVHETGKCNTAMTEILDNLLTGDDEESAARSSDEEQDDAVDPRWSKLKDLKI